MKYTFGHYGICCDSRYREEKPFTVTECDYDMTCGAENGYYIYAFDNIKAYNITYNKAVLTDGEAKEILVDYIARKTIKQILELNNILEYLKGV